MVKKLIDEIYELLLTHGPTCDYISKFSPLGRLIDICLNREEAFNEFAQYIYLEHNDNELFKFVKDNTFVSNMADTVREMKEHDCNTCDGDCLEEKKDQLLYLKCEENDLIGWFGSDLVSKLFDTKFENSSVEEYTEYLEEDFLSMQIEALNDKNYLEPYKDEKNIFESIEKNFKRNAKVFRNLRERQINHHKHIENFDELDGDYIELIEKVEKFEKRLDISLFLKNKLSEYHLPFSNLESILSYEFQSIDGGIKNYLWKSLIVFDEDEAESLEFCKGNEKIKTKKINEILKMFKERIDTFQVSERKKYSEKLDEFGKKIKKYRSYIVIDKFLHKNCEEELYKLSEDAKSSFIKYNNQAIHDFKFLLDYIFNNLAQEEDVRKYSPKGIVSPPWSSSYKDLTYLARFFSEDNEAQKDFNKVINQMCNASYIETILFLSKKQKIYINELQSYKDFFNKLFDNRTNLLKKYIRKPSESLTSEKNIKELKSLVANIEKANKDIKPLLSAVKSNEDYINTCKNIIGNLEKDYEINNFITETYRSVAKPCSDMAEECLNKIFCEKTLEIFNELDTLVTSIYTDKESDELYKGYSLERLIDIDKKMVKEAIKALEKEDLSAEHKKFIYEQENIIKKIYKTKVSNFKARFSKLVKASKNKKIEYLTEIDKKLNLMSKLTDLEKLLDLDNVFDSRTIGRIVEENNSEKTEETASENQEEISKKAQKLKLNLKRRYEKFREDFTLYIQESRIESAQKQINSAFYLNFEDFFIFGKELKLLSPNVRFWINYQNLNFSAARLLKYAIDEYDEEEVIYLNSVDLFDKYDEDKYRELFDNIATNPEYLLNFLKINHSKPGIERLSKILENAKLLTVEKPPRTKTDEEKALTGEYNKTRLKLKYISNLFGSDCYQAFEKKDYKSVIAHLYPLISVINGKILTTDGFKDIDIWDYEEIEPLKEFLDDLYQIDGDDIFLESLMVRLGWEVYQNNKISEPEYEEIIKKHELCDKICQIPHEQDFDYLRIALINKNMHANDLKNKYSSEDLHTEVKEFIEEYFPNKSYSELPAEYSFIWNILITNWPENIKHKGTNQEFEDHENYIKNSELSDADKDLSIGSNYVGRATHFYLNKDQANTKTLSEKANRFRKEYDSKKNLKELKHPEEPQNKPKENGS